MTDISKDPREEKNNNKYIDGLGEPDLYNYHVEPSFSIDEQGRVTCNSHSEIKQINKLQNFPNLDFQFELLNSCLTCRNYEFDDCYFPKSEINKIEHDRNNRKIHCILCGAKIDRLLTILYSFYYKERFNVEIPIICCSCYSSLGNNTFNQKIRAKLLINLLGLGISLLLLIRNFLSLILFFNIYVLIFILFLLPLVFWSYISIRNINDLYLVWKGKKFYDMFFKS